MKRAVLIIMLFITITSNISSQLSTITLFVDYATFNTSENFTYVEVYLSFFQNNLVYQQEEDSLLVAHFSHTINILQNDSLLYQKTSINGKFIFINRIDYPRQNKPTNSRTF